MKRQLWPRMLVLGIVIALAPACCFDDDDDGYCSDRGTIIGIDYRECACCGGWFILIDGDTLRAPVLPTDFTPSPDPREFPLKVYLEWNPAANPCLGDEIDVDCIRRR